MQNLFFPTLCIYLLVQNRVIEINWNVEVSLAPGAKFSFFVELITY